MKLQFQKYQGTGNDFIILQGSPSLDQEQIQSLCDRRMGIGADGLIIIDKHPKLDFKMIYYNSDGLQSSMCGNGGRCAVVFANSQGMAGTQCRFEAIDGEHQGYLEDGFTRISMQDVDQVSYSEDHFELDTGSPHYVKFVANVSTVDVKTQGAEIRNRAPYQEQGINVNFVSEQGSGIALRTYERGVEDETLSCGTGVVAAAISFAIKAGLPDGKHNIGVTALGGELEVSFIRQGEHFNALWLKGSATFVYTGELDL